VFGGSPILMSSIVLTVNGPVSGSAQATIQEFDATQNTLVPFAKQYADPITGVRTLVSPTEAVAFFQMSHGYTVTVTPFTTGNVHDIASGGIGVSDYEVNGLTFTKFVLPANLPNMSFNVTSGKRPTLNFTSGLTIPAGAIIDLKTGSGSIGLINVNGGAF